MELKSWASGAIPFSSDDQSIKAEALAATWVPWEAGKEIDQRDSQWLISIFEWKTIFSNNNFENIQLMMNLDRIVDHI